MIWFIILLISTFVFSAGLTRALIATAGRLGFVDVPCERSSHHVPLPRGGGIGFFVSFLTGVIALWAAGIISTDLVKPLLTAGPLVAVVGFIGDRKGISALFRLVTHFIAAAITVFFVTDGFRNNMNISFLGTIPTGLQIAYALLFMAWMINLYNFMDGVDGMAATPAIVVAIFSALLCYWQGNLPLALLYALIACSVSGFLYFNWSPARIFMGDGGAYFLGFLFASLALMNKMFFGESLLALMILMGTFIADATYTLLRRAISGEKFYQPHKKHAFQRAVQKGWSHSRVVLIYNLITAFWLAPWAIIAVNDGLHSINYLLIAYAPLLAGVVYLRAGSRTEAPSPAKTWAPTPITVSDFLQTNEVPSDLPGFPPPQPNYSNSSISNPVPRA